MNTCGAFSNRTSRPGRSSAGTTPDRLSGSSGCTRGLPSASACAAVTTASPGSMSTLTSSAASSARYRDSATTMAIGSPTYRTSPSASRRRGVLSTGPGADGRIRELISAAVSTATTPGARRASLTSSSTIRPRATVLRTKVA